MTHETLMSKIVKIFQGPTDRPTDGPTDRRTDRPTDRPTDMTTPRSSSPELKKLMNKNLFLIYGFLDFFGPAEGVWHLQNYCFGYYVLSCIFKTFQAGREGDGGGDGCQIPF